MTIIKIIKTKIIKIIRNSYFVNQKLGNYIKNRNAKLILPYGGCLLEIAINACEVQSTGRSRSDALKQARGAITKFFRYGHSIYRRRANKRCND